MIEDSVSGLPGCTPTNTSVKVEWGLWNQAEKCVQCLIVEARIEQKIPDLMRISTSQPQKWMIRSLARWRFVRR
ncbi:MAG: hypothetical protein P8J59_09305 [Phycisphaerales bacterium]|jgi:hypothetical protein|nr:hypothetical protein [Phycisphaerales bacterium]